MGVGLQVLEEDRDSLCPVVYEIIGLGGGRIAGNIGVQGGVEVKEVKGGGQYRKTAVSID